MLTLKENKVGTTVVSAYGYTVNSLGQRTNGSQTGTAFASNRNVTWGYDSLGQVVSADSSETGHDRAYQYDAIGNRKKSADSLTLPGTDNYTSNALNQYSTINHQLSTINPSYDADGNATAYPLPVAPTANSALAWDAENRLISTTVNGTGTSYLYDSQSRRIAKITGNVAELTVYDTWNPIADYIRSGEVPAVLSQTHIWGTDLSGTLQGAGGVGGLLSVSTPITNNPLTINSCFPTYDGNGNVSEYLGSNGAISAHLEYDAFGWVIVATGSASDFSIRFSTKKEDAETGLNYYGYRYYDSVTGRWLSKDPIEEQGGMNLYGFIRNDALSRQDILGLVEVTQGGNQTKKDQEAGTGKVDVEFEVTLEKFEKNKQCCYRAKTVNWRIVKHLPKSMTDLTGDEFLKWYDKWKNHELQFRYDNAGHVTYNAIDIHESVHVGQVERIADKIKEYFEKTYSKEFCYESSEERDKAFDSAKKAFEKTRSYDPTKGGWDYEKPAAEAEWAEYARLAGEVAK